MESSREDRKVLLCLICAKSFFFHYVMYLYFSFQQPNFASSWMLQSEIIRASDTNARIVFMQQIVLHT